MNTQPETSESRAAEALVFLRGDQGADPGALHSVLIQVEGVAGCDPVLGDWNVVLRLAAKDREELRQIVERQIRNLKDVADAETHFREDAPKTEGNAAGEGNKATSYAILDVESGKVKDLGARFAAMPGVARYDVTDGGRQIILKLAGESPREIRNVLGGKVRFLPGVLRIRQLNVI